MFTAIKAVQENNEIWDIGIEPKDLEYGYTLLIPKRRAKHSQPETNAYNIICPRLRGVDKAFPPFFSADLVFFKLYEHFFGRSTQEIPMQRYTVDIHQRDLGDSGKIHTHQYHVTSSNPPKQSRAHHILIESAVLPK